MTGAILVEGLPGAGKSTTATRLAAALADDGTAVDHWPEDRPGHPVDLADAAVLGAEELAALRSAGPGWRAALDGAIRVADAWVVPYGGGADLPAGLAEALRRHDVYDGDVPLARHARTLLSRWAAFGSAPPPPAVQVWECVLLQNPGCVFHVRHDRPEALEPHVHALVAAVRAHAPALVYLDAGDPEPVVRRAAAERPAAWLDLVVGYHTGQGHGLARGLRGFDGYVEVLRARREIELDLLPRLALPTLVVDPRSGSAGTEILAFARDHLTAAGEP